MERSRDAARRKREQAFRKREKERLAREAREARCAVCGLEVTIEDRCNDGLYLHRECAYAESSR
jgi:hypothetical protein